MTKRYAGAMQFHPLDLLDIEQIVRVLSNTEEQVPIRLMPSKPTYEWNKRYAGHLARECRNALAPVLAERGYDISRVAIMVLLKHTTEPNPRLRLLFGDDPCGKR